MCEGPLPTSPLTFRGTLYGGQDGFFWLGEAETLTFLSPTFLSWLVDTYFLFCFSPKHPEPVEGFSLTCMPNESLN